MAKQTRRFRLPSEDDTTQLARHLSSHTRAGDCILLRGEIGAGKSAFARAFIRARLGPETDVPSPTFTLVQTYQDDLVEVWHADLYRLGDPHEVLELGLVDAFETQICLIEWPELLGDLAPENALDIHMVAKPDHHVATLTFGENWAGRLPVILDEM